MNLKGIYGIHLKAILLFIIICSVFFPLLAWLANDEQKAVLVLAIVGHQDLFVIMLFLVLALIAVGGLGVLISKDQGIKLVG